MSKPYIPQSAPGSSWGWDAKRRNVTLRFYLPNGKQTIVRGDDHHACRAARDARLEADAATAGITVDTIGGVAAAWFEFNRSGSSPSTLNKRRWSLGLINDADFGIGHIPSNDLDVAA